MGDRSRGDSGDDLQFDKAEFGAGAEPIGEARCLVCRLPIAEEYYDVNGQVACPRCKDRVGESLRGGSRSVRAVRALVMGGVVAAACSVAYYYIRELTGYEVALVSIVVGLAVGVSVRKGAQYRGGLFYQFMAVLLTYIAIVGSHTPTLIGEVRERHKISAKESDGTDMGSRAEADVATTATLATDSEEGTSATAAVALAGTSADTSAPAVSAAAMSEAEGNMGRADRPSPGILTILMAYGAVVAATCIIVPYILIQQGEIILILIVLFGLWQAWVINRKPKLVVTGPHRLGQPKSVAAVEA